MISFVLSLSLPAFANALSATVVASQTRVPLLSFPQSLDLFERIDDVVMGGVSSSSVRSFGEGASWVGIVRVEGGGFCGTRTKPFDEPIDLSSYQGLYIDAKLASDEEPERRAWKCTVRCEQDRGEVVYTAEWTPGLLPSFVPFSDFQLVRGPRLVPGAPPLSSKNLEKVFGFGLTCSRFGAPVGNETKLVENFRPGFFRVDLHEIGVYGQDGSREPKRPSVATSQKSVPNSANNPNLVLKALRPISSLVFSEKRRRRNRARELLVERAKVKTKLGARLYGQRMIKRGMKGMSGLGAKVQGIKELFSDVVASILTLPLRLVFRLVFKLIAATKQKKPSRS